MEAREPDRRGTGTQWSREFLQVREVAYALLMVRSRACGRAEESQVTCGCRSGRWLRRSVVSGGRRIRTPLGDCVRGRKLRQSTFAKLGSDVSRPLGGRRAPRLGIKRRVEHAPQPIGQFASLLRGMLRSLTGAWASRILNFVRACRWLRRHPRAGRAGARSEQSGARLAEAATGWIAPRGSVCSSLQQPCVWSGWRSWSRGFSLSFPVAGSL